MLFEKLCLILVWSGSGTETFQNSEPNPGIRNQTLITNYVSIRLHWYESKKPYQIPILPKKSKL
jgi:hypothetical protein